MSNIPLQGGPVHDANGDEAHVAPTSSDIESLQTLQAGRPAEGAHAGRESQRSAAPSAASPERYVSYSEVGRGGVGSVERRYDRALRREIAIKILDGPDAEWSQTFVEEAQITAQLEHPNIVPVHELGTLPDGKQYFTMKLVRGITLDAWLARELVDRSSSEQLGAAIEIYLKVCDALSFAHAQGVVHGDLKPSNVMVGAFGEVYVMDWGLALLMPDAREVPEPLAINRRRSPRVGEGMIGPRGSPRFGEGVIGTPAYMPPEQAIGKLADVDKLSDVYGLGALLYHIVVGSPPFVGRTLEEVIAAARAGQFVDPELAVPPGTISPELTRVIRKAMSREKRDRHTDVKALKHDVQQALQRGTHLPRRWYSAGHVFCREGERGDEAYVICEGRCVAYRRAPDGSRRVLREMGPRSVFGEMAIISDTPRTATVEAIDRVQVVVVSRKVLEEELGLNAWVGDFVKALAERFREREARVDALENGNPPR